MEMQTIRNIITNELKKPISRRTMWYTWNWESEEEYISEEKKLIENLENLNMLDFETSEYKLVKFANLTYLELEFISKNLKRNGINVIETLHTPNYIDIWNVNFDPNLSSNDGNCKYYDVFGDNNDIGHYYDEFNKLLDDNDINLHCGFKFDFFLKFYISSKLGYIEIENLNLEDFEYSKIKKLLLKQMKKGEQYDKIRIN